MTKKISEISVFFPAFNEEGNIENTVAKAKKVLAKVAQKWEIVIVDDGSTDKTPEIADKLAKNEKRIKVIHHKVNRGYGGGLQSGFYNSKYDWIVYNDADGQFDFAEIDKFIAVKDSAELLVGFRIKRQDAWHRLLFAKGWALALFIFFGQRLRDVDCGFKMVRKEVIKKIPKLESERGGMINAELAIKTKKAGFRIKQIGVHHYPRKAGRATGAQFKVIIKSFADLFKLWQKLR